MLSFLCFWRLCLFFLSVHLTVGGIAIENVDNGTRTDADRYFQLTEQLETVFKNTVKSVTKSFLPSILKVQEDSKVSQRCTQSLGKYIINLNRAKMWAAQMLDATSKIPPGILMGTFSDFGSFDECLGVEVLQRNGKLDFRGSSCSLVVKLPFPALKRKQSIAKFDKANPEITVGQHFRDLAKAISYKPFKFVVCVPSTCTVDDIQHIADRISNGTDIRVEVPHCYVKESLVFEPIHIVVIACLGILLILGISGSIFEMKLRNSGIKTLSVKGKLLKAFSLSANLKYLMSKPRGSTELRCIHGIRAMGIFWIILGHSYVFVDFDILKNPIVLQTWFGDWSFEFINNAWISVDTFFLLSGILVVYIGLPMITKTGGKINIPLLILRRYIRLTPSVLLLIGLVFFMPLISSGPFFYDQVGESLETCRKYWWTTILYFSNWWGVDKACLNTTWYLAADFQIHILALFLLLLLYKYSKVGVAALILAIVFSCTMVGVSTWYWDLGPNIQLSTGDQALILETVNKIHIQTFTHLGPFCIGMIVGYYIFTYKEKKLNKYIVVLGWCLSIIASLSGVLGIHRFSAGIETSQGLSIFYAAVHRSVFTLGVAWVLLACITGYGGPVNSLLSSSVWAPISRLTYMIYLIHPLVIRVKYGSLAERRSTEHHEALYVYFCHVLLSIVLAAPLYLLLEAPLSNLEKVVLNRNKEDDSNPQKESEERSDVTLITVKRHPLELTPNHLTMNSEKSLC